MNFAILESRLKQFQSELLLFAVMEPLLLESAILVHQKTRKFSMPSKSSKVVKTMILSGRAIPPKSTLYSAYLLYGKKTNIPVVRKTFASSAAASPSAPHRFRRHAVRPLGESLHLDFEDFEVLSTVDIDDYVIRMTTDLNDFEVLDMDDVPK